MLCQALGEHGISYVLRTWAGVDDDVDGGELGSSEAEGVANHAFNAIAIHCIAYRTCGNRQTQARKTDVVGSY